MTISALVFCLPPKLKNNEIQMAIGLQTQTFVERRFIHTSVFLDYVILKWFTRAPVPIGSYSNIVKVFSLDVWVSFMLTLLLFSALFFWVYNLYKDLNQDLIGEPADSFTWGYR